MKAHINKWYKAIPIRQKLYFVVGTMAFLIAIELFTLWFAVKTLSSVRAYVAGEGLWSKAQKDAGYYLQKYGHTHNENDYQQFLKFIKVPMGDAKARNQLAKKAPDIIIAKEGFIEGLNHPDDIDDMIWLFRYFSNIQYINNAIKIWGEAEPLARQLITIGSKLHEEIVYTNQSQEKINETLKEIDPINERLTQLENDFSYTLGEGSRWLENLVLKMLFIMALTVECTGLILTISVNYTISRGINEVVSVSKNVADGNLEKRARIFTSDEIGLLASQFNNMIDELSELIKQKTKVEEDLKKQKSTLVEYAKKLEQSNGDLEQFAYVASHDLKEPLRTIGSYVQLLENKQKNTLDADSKEFIAFVVDGVKRMNILIDDLLAYSRVNTTSTPLEWVKIKDVIDGVLFSFKDEIENQKIKIQVSEMPILYTHKTQMIQLFQNLISNAIKFRTGENPEIVITAVENNLNWTFSIKDNGIGIDPKYADKIFIIFQRLHTRSEYNGTGIGLAICKKIVEQQGGQIWVKSEIGKGADFCFTIGKNGI